MIVTTFTLMIFIMSFFQFDILIMGILIKLYNPTFEMLITIL